MTANKRLQTRIRSGITDYILSESTTRIAKIKTALMIRHYDNTLMYRIKKRIPAEYRNISHDIIIKFCCNVKPRSCLCKHN